MATLLLLSALTTAPGSTPLGAAQVFPAPDSDASYFKVEAKGRWTVVLDPNSKKVRSASFTCGKFTVFGRIHVVLPDNKEMHELARKLHGETVIVTGTAALDEEPPMGRLPNPPRFMLFVESLKAAAKEMK